MLPFATQIFSSTLLNSVAYDPSGVPNNVQLATCLNDSATIHQDGYKKSASCAVGGGCNEEQVNDLIRSPILLVVAITIFLLVASVGLSVIKLQSVYPMTGYLHRDLHRPLPLVVRVIGTILDWLPWTFWVVHDAEELLHKGAIDAGLPPTYKPEVTEAVHKLCDSIRNDKVQFHWIGRLKMHDTIVGGLSHYLQVNEAHRLTPELSQIKLKDPIFV
eukprot:5313801-Ditylum_brightwellii.AAC.1